MNNDPIASDDPLAKEKLTKRIADLEAHQAQMVAANKIVRKRISATPEAIALLVAIGFTEETGRLLFTPDCCNRIGFASYELQNNGANIKRLKKRLAHIMEHAADETSQEEIGECTITDNVEAHRVQIAFRGRPSDPVRLFLKSHGFRWAPSVPAWQGHRSENALYYAREAAKMIQAEAKPDWTHIEGGAEKASNEAECAHGPGPISECETCDPANRPLLVG